MTDDQKAAKNDYSKKYREANREALRAKAKAYYQANRAAIIEKEKARYHTNPERKAYTKACNQRRKGMVFAPGQTPEAMLAAQGGKCAICAQNLAPGPNCHTDHCHKTGRVRGILCNGCNIGLGYFRENPEALAGAIAYLRTNALSAASLASSSEG